MSEIITVPQIYYAPIINSTLVLNDEERNKSFFVCGCSSCKNKKNREGLCMPFCQSVLCIRCGTRCHADLDEGVHKCNCYGTPIKSIKFNPLEFILVQTPLKPAIGKNTDFFKKCALNHDKLCNFDREICSICGNFGIYNDTFAQMLCSGCLSKKLNLSNY